MVSKFQRFNERTPLCTLVCTFLSVSPCVCVCVTKRRVISNLINTNATVNLNLSMPLVIICVMYWCLSWTLTSTYQSVLRGNMGMLRLTAVVAVASWVCLCLMLKCWPSGCNVYQTTYLWSIKSLMRLARRPLKTTRCHWAPTVCLADCSCIITDMFWCVTDYTVCAGVGLFVLLSCTHPAPPESSSSLVL